MFLAGRRFRLPLANYFVVPQQFKTTCPAKFSHTRYNGVYANKCKELGVEWEGKWSALLSYPKGTRYGDQVCKIAAEELGEDNIPSFRFPDGIQFGYYYNWCGSKLWRDSTGRSDVRVCCKDGFYKNCQELIEEMEAEAAAEEARLTAELEAEDAKVAAEIGGGGKPDKKGGVESDNKGGAKSDNKGDKTGEKQEGSGTSAVSPGSTVAVPSRVESLKSSLEQNKTLSDAEIAEVKKIISAYMASAEVLLKKAKELEDLLEKRKLL